MDSHGGWIASASDLMRFLLALNGPGKTRLLPGNTADQLYARPPAPLGRESDGTLSPTYYACGWSVRPVGDAGANHWHNGSLPGSYSFMAHLANGFAWVALFNQRTGDSDRDAAIDPGLYHASNAKPTDS